MKTEIVKKSNSEQKEYLIKDAPYTLFGSPSIPESITFTMKAGGLRKILDEFELDGDDTFRIEVFSGSRATEYSFIKHEKAVKNVSGSLPLQTKLEMFYDFLYERGIAKQLGVGVDTVAKHFIDEKLSGNDR